MMMSPEAYYDMELQGKTPEEIQRKIRSLRREITTLKRKMEKPDYIPKHCPGDDVRISCDRQYLARALKVLADMGEECPLTATEKRDAAFNASLDAIHRVELVICKHRFEPQAYSVRMNDPVEYSREGHSCFSPEEEEAFAEFDHTPREDFLEYLADIHLGEWRKHYSPERYGYAVMDGVSWNINIFYKDGRKPFRCGGDNAYPYNFDRFCELMGVDLTPDDEEDEE